MEHDELAIHLEALQRESCYRVDAVLKQSPFEVTQRVYFVGTNGAESGPYIRKFIMQGVGLGSVYQRMYEAQRGGRRFKYIPDMLECYSRNDRMVVVMECVRGQTLQEAVYQHDPSIGLAADVFPHLCDAVSELHTEFDPPIIHRDIKPSNVILTGEGLALIDFGISREYDADAETDTTHFGTREFAPPEQYGFGQTGVYSDVFSLGMVLFFCLTEEIPNAKTRERGFRDERIPEPLRQVIVHASALDPAQRYASSAELKAAFLAAVTEIEQSEQHLDEEAACDSTGNVDERSTAWQSAFVDADPAQSPSAQVNSTQAGSTQTSTSTSKGAKPRTKILVVLAIAAVAVLGLLVLIGLAANNGASGEAVKSSDSSVAVAPEEPSEASKIASTSAASVASDVIDNGIKISAAPKNGFDPNTNLTVAIGDLQFQIPRYFKKNSDNSDDTLTYYYAETGSSVSMLMTRVSDMEEPIEADDMEDAIEGYMQGILEADQSAEVLGYTDFELAGCTARAITSKRTTAGLPTVSKLVYFIREGSPLVGVIVLGQTTNAQFDYSADFEKILASATPVPQE